MSVSLLDRVTPLADYPCEELSARLSHPKHVFVIQTSIGEPEYMSVNRMPIQLEINTRLRGTTTIVPLHKIMRFGGGVWDRRLLLGATPGMKYWAGL